MLTIKDIVSQYGLPEKFLRRCVDALKVELEPYTTRGNNHQLQFDTASSGIFEQIRIHKSKNFSLPDIVREIKKNLTKNQLPTLLEKVENQGGESRKNPLENDLIKRLLDSEKARYNAELRVFHAEKEELENRIRRHENDIMLITDGSTNMNEFLRKKAKTEVEKKEIIKTLRDIRFWQFIKKGHLLNKLEKL